jgi:soluble lytic murein transglycosylase-like protein
VAVTGIGSAVARIQEIRQATQALAAFSTTLSAQETAIARTTPRRAPAPAADVDVSGWAERLPSAGRAWVDEIEWAAGRADLDPRLLSALVWAESSFDQGARSPAGAIGLTQLMPGTAAGLHVDPYDPAENLLGGARYLSLQLERFGSVELALAAYNAGPGRVDEAGGVPPETWDYVHRVLGYYRTLGGTP